MSSLPVKDLLVTVKESFEHTQRVSCCQEPCPPNPACFHYPKYFQPCMHVDVPKSQCSRGVRDSGGGGGGGDWHRRGCQRSPSPPHRTRPSFQLCCCCAHRKNSPVRQPLDCLPDGQTVTLPVVRAGVREEAPEQHSPQPTAPEGDGGAWGGGDAVGGCLRWGRGGLWGRRLRAALWSQRECVEAELRIIEASQEGR